ncbi:unnamed protein product [Ceutorhynchus assimilis]|uniref:C2H2-type domain-containing protein n=1 Tax=Ceutorhynchus assimilis TaxID=467358 RepID=A0A9N9MW83_9CUCU|nr:unnamed protein product [Ceutorhynchus assimilis]
MFVCEFCNKSFTRKDNLKRHGDCRSSTNICSQCGGTFRSAGALQRHVMEIHPAPRALKRKAEDSLTPMTKQARLDRAGTSTSVTRRCQECDLEIPTNHWVGHLRSLQHRANTCVEQEEGVELIKTSFKCRIATYRLPSKQDPTSVKEFLQHLQKKFIQLVGDMLNKFNHIKVGMELFGRFLLQTKEIEEVKSFNTKFTLVNEGADLEELFQQFSNILAKKCVEFQEKESGWALQQLLYLEISINKVNPLKASSYLPLPKEIDAKKAVLNIQNWDQKCFMWSVLAQLHPVDRTQNANRVANYSHYENELDFTGIGFPIKLKDIRKFEQLNNISINVYGLDIVYKYGRNIVEVVGPLYFTESRKATHVNLLLISNDFGNNHYCLIKNMSRLISSQLSKHEKKKYLCDGCLLYFSSEQKLQAHQEHDCGHVSVQLPSTNLITNKYGEKAPENILKFKNFEKKLKVPFTVYADFETIIEPVEREQKELDPENSYTIKTHKAIPYSFAYYIKCDFDDSHSIFKTFRGIDAQKVFVDWLESDCKSIYNRFMKNIVNMHPLSPEQENEFRDAINCHICEKPFKVGDERVRDHCHLTGNFRAAAHSICNVNYTLPTHIPIFFHNMSGFDSHLFVKELAQGNEKLDVIPQNKERYISFTKHILVDKILLDETGKYKQVFLKLRFLDSFRFMASSLDKLSQNLKPEQCREVRKFFPAEDEFQIIRQKGVFPYSYVDSFSKLNDNKLPSIDDFYNQLRKETIKPEDYERAQTVWNLFKCKTLGQYSDIYLKSDVLILADVFENFRDVCLSTYGLDPCQYYTAPGLSFDAALKTTAVKLELLTDIDMIHFLKRGIRGGVSQCSIRKAVANNKFIPHYDASKPTSYIMYLDATNLYGAAMSQYLPTGNFKWLDADEIKTLDYTKLDKNSDTGYIFEIDLEYPEDLHYRHNDLPFCPESVIPKDSRSKIKKLIPNFERKQKYIIHFQSLQQAISHGIKPGQIHRVLSFNQSPWLKIYIDLNTIKRNAASNKFEKDFFKLMNNAVFGKTMENVEKRVDIKLITHWENIGRKLGAEAWISKPHFKDITIFGENLVAIHMAKQKVVYDKPIYVGFAILDISKTIMYDFLYSYIKPKYGDKASLLYTDTDSLILKVDTDNFYDDMRENLNRFDTSNYSQNNSHNLPVNQSILGKMKDEYAGKIVWEFYGTGAKAYCVNVEGELTKKAKGVPDYVTKKELGLADYKAAVDVEGTLIHRQMNTFRSHKHDMFIELKNKVALSYADDKRYVIPGTEYTLAWGHRDIVLYKE